MTGFWIMIFTSTHLSLRPLLSEPFSNSRSKQLVALAESLKTITVAGFPIKLQSSIKSVGVYLDSHMSFDKQVSEICKASYFQIRALRHIRLSLTTEAAKAIAVVIVGSRFDYCKFSSKGMHVRIKSCSPLVGSSLFKRWPFHVQRSDSGKCSGQSFAIIDVIWTVRDLKNDSPGGHCCGDFSILSSFYNNLVI